MRWFTVSGRFQASDIDDALARLSYHFEDLRGPDSEPLRTHFPGEYSVTVAPEAESATGRAEPS